MSPTALPSNSSARVTRLSLTALALLALPAAHADLISSESFSGYNTGALNATSPSPTVPGYTGNWTAVDFGDAQPAISPGSLTYGYANDLGSTGDKVAVPSGVGKTAKASSGRIYRLLDHRLAVTATTTGVRYLCFLFRSGQETGATLYQTLALFDGPVSQGVDTNRTFDAGLTTNDAETGTFYNFSTNNAYISTGVAADTAVHLFLIKFKLGDTPASDSVTVWIDPVIPPSGDPIEGGTIATGMNITFDRLVLSDYDENSAAWDEIRWGDTFADVVAITPIPHPIPGTVRPRR